MNMEAPGPDPAAAGFLAPNGIQKDNSSGVGNFAAANFRYSHSLAPTKLERLEMELMRARETINNFIGIEQHLAAQVELQASEMSRVKARALEVEAENQKLRAVELQCVDLDREVHSLRDQNAGLASQLTAAKGAVEMLRGQWSVMQGRQKEMDSLREDFTKLASAEQEKKEKKEESDRMKRMKRYASSLRETCQKQSIAIEEKANELKASRLEVQEAEALQRKQLGQLKALKEENKKLRHQVKHSVYHRLARRSPPSSHRSRKPNHRRKKRLSGDFEESKDQMITRLRQRVEDEAATALLASQRELKSVYEQKIREARETAGHREKLVREEVDKLKIVIKKLLTAKSGERWTEEGAEALARPAEAGKDDAGQSTENGRGKKDTAMDGSPEGQQDGGKEDFTDLESSLNSNNLAQLGSFKDIMERAENATEGEKKKVPFIPIPVLPKGDRGKSFYISDGEFFESTSEEESDFDDEW